MSDSNDSPYLPHLSDPLRREIAVQYMRHELRKLFPSMRDEDVWKQLDSEVPQWFEENPSFAPVRDFWNGLHAFSMGFKLKNIVSLLTSLNIAWENREIAVQDLVFGTVLGEAKQVGITPLSVADAHAWFCMPEHAAELKAAREAHEMHSHQTASRDADPIFVVVRDGKYVISDGNRRVLRAVLFDTPTIRAYVGTPTAQPPIFESWVPTSTLLDLVSFYHYWSSLNRDALSPVAGVLSELLRDSSAARYEFLNRCVNPDRPEDQKLIEKMKELIPTL